MNETSNDGRMPVLFVGHGSPMNVIEDNRWSRAFASLAVEIPRPTAVLAISAHWYVPGTLLTAASAPRTIHDFSGFPAALYEIHYRAPGDVDLARRVRDRLGEARASLDETWPHVRERRAFDVPLVQFQGVSFPLAEAETHVAAARLLCYDTLRKRDRGERHTAEAAMCKWWAPKKAHDILIQCVLLHGHAGWGDDYPHQQRMRDVMGLQIGDGTAQIQKMVIAREVAGKVTVSHV